MEQKGKDEDGILGFLSEDIQKELRRGKRLVCTFKLTCSVDIASKLFINNYVLLCMCFYEVL